MKTILVDGHVHLYPGYNWALAVSNMLRNLGEAGQNPDPIAVGLLTESRRYAFFRTVQDHPDDYASPALQLFPHSDGQSLVIRSGDQIRGYLIAGRQLVTRERLEILAVGHDTRIADGLPARDAIDHVLASGALPVVAWSPGKWFGRRGEAVRTLIMTHEPGSLLIGDSLMRPRLWPQPRLMRLARERGFLVLAGSDPLPLRGEERWLGRYGISVEAPFDETAPADSIRRLLTNTGARLALIGGRSAPLSFLARWISNFTGFSRIPD